MYDIAWTTLIDALVRIEGVAPDDSGMLAFGLDPGYGGIFVEKGRICWAAARGMQRRLTDLLRTCAAVPDVDLDRIYARCRSEGRMLGQTLVDEGWITARELETVLRRHSAESLVVLCRDEGQLPIWTSRGTNGYAARFTFRPLDVLFDVVALGVPHLQHAARLELEQYAGQGRRGGAFYYEPGREVAVPVAAFGDMTVQALWTLGRWATSVPMATRELGTTPRFTLAATAAGDTIMVWWHDAVLYAIACDDRSAVVSILARHLAEDAAAAEAAR